MGWARLEGMWQKRPRLEEEMPKSANTAAKTDPEPQVLHSSHSPAVSTSGRKPVLFTPLGSPGIDPPLSPATTWIQKAEMRTEGLQSQPTWCTVSQRTLKRQFRLQVYENAEEMWDSHKLQTAIMRSCSAHLLWHLWSLNSWPWHFQTTHLAEGSVPWTPETCRSCHCKKHFCHFSSQVLVMADACMQSSNQQARNHTVILRCIEFNPDVFPTKLPCLASQIGVSGSARPWEGKDWVQAAAQACNSFYNLNTQYQTI